MSKYYPPTFKLEHFHCVHCGVYAQQYWHDLQYYYFNERLTIYKLCICAHCNKQSIWNSETEAIVDPLFTTNIPAHQDMPDEIKSLYNEALSVLDLSPKAAAALMRLAIQNLMPFIGADKGNLDKSISKLVSEGLPLKIQQALDYCRVIGNSAVHPNELNLDDTPDMAHAMFNMINFIVEKKIAEPKRVEEFFGRLPSGAKEAIEKRDGK